MRYLLSFFILMPTLLLGGEQSKLEAVYQDFQIQNERPSVRLSPQQENARLNRIILELQLEVSKLKSENSELRESLSYSKEDIDAQYEQMLQEHEEEILVLRISNILRAWYGFSLLEETMTDPDSIMMLNKIYDSISLELEQHGLLPSDFSHLSMPLSEYEVSEVLRMKDMIQ